MAKDLGGIKKFGANTPIPLTRVLDTCGLRDTLWCFRCTIEDSEVILKQFVCQCTERVLYNYKLFSSGDMSAYKQIVAACCLIGTKDKSGPAMRADSVVSAARKFIAAKTADGAASAARAASTSGEVYSAGMAAYSASYKEAMEVERLWQVATLREMLDEDSEH